MEIIKNEKGEVWAIKEGFIIPPAEKELNVEESTQRSYLLDVLGNFAANNTKILNSLLDSEATRSYDNASIISDGQSVFMPEELESVRRWRQRIANNNAPVMNIIEQVEDIEELKTLLRAIAYMPGYSLLKVGFLEEVTDAIIAQTKKQLCNAEG